LNSRLVLSFRRTRLSVWLARRESRGDTKAGALKRSRVKVLRRLEERPGFPGAQQHE
jgi:hypothetical protein